MEILQIHYYLNNDKHSMDAKVLNKAEAEVLKIIGEVSKILDVHIVTETQALDEGGIKAVYKFLSKNKTQKQLKTIATFFAGIIAVIISEVVSDSIKTDAEYENLKKQELNLRIEKLQKELKEDENHNQINEQNAQIVDDLAIYLSEINKIKISKSNFYSQLLKEGKIEKVSTQEFDSDFKPVGKEKIVPRADFNKFIIEESEIEPDYKEQITLEIVSPVLKKNRLNWKAIYNDENITFNLKDEDFKNLVINKNLSFSNGTKIICDLETRQKMDKEGEISTAGRSVFNVTAILYSDGTKVDVLN